MTAPLYVIAQRDTEKVRSTTNMARIGRTALFLVILFVMCSCIHGKYRRFGAVAKTLHMPPLAEAAKWGENFVVLHAGDLVKEIGEDPVDEVDGFLRRFRRDTSDSRGIARTVVSEAANICTVTDVVGFCCP